LVSRRKLSVVFTAPAAGRLTATLSTRARHPVVLARGRVAFAKAGRRTVTLTLVRAQVPRLRRARRMSCTLAIRFTPTLGQVSSVKGSLSLPK
jgi:hypothetical protein